MGKFNDGMKTALEYIKVFVANKTFFTFLITGLIGGGGTWWKSEQVVEAKEEVAETKAAANDSIAQLVEYYRKRDEENKHEPVKTKTIVVKSDEQAIIEQCRQIAASSKLQHERKWHGAK